MEAIANVVNTTVQELSEVKGRLSRIYGELEAISTRLGEIKSQLQRNDLPSDKIAFLMEERSSLTTREATLTTLYTELLHKEARLEAEAKEERHRAEAKEAASLAPPLILS
jgi:predicted  nucleic acid-binding Zn-ribbon protein